MTNVRNPNSVWFDLYAIIYPHRKGLSQITIWLNENDIEYDKRLYCVGMLNLKNMEDAMAFKLRWL